ncbi:MAG TPA: glycosyltransferase family 4 protein [Candidatus Baltobacteraceae bacterium]|nr:glycosyltransferase family 4 protein [Candidatus Baltobacteraceae bacterium]
MRILHVIADLGTYGAERLVELLVDELRGHDVDLELAVATIFSSSEAATRLRVPVLDAARRNRYDLGFFVRLCAAIDRWRPDVVHTHMHMGKYWGRLAALLCRVPVIVHTEHNSEFGVSRFYRLPNRFLSARTSRVVTFSQTQRAALAADEGIPLDRIVVIPNGIALAPFDPAQRERARAALGAAPGERVLLHVGRLHAVKNQRLAIEAMPLLPDDVRLYFAGDGADRAALEELARTRGVGERVTFLGFRDDATALVAGADVALVTSHNEAMPLAVIEAMAAQAPLASTPWHGAREMLGGGAYGIVADGYAPPQLAAAVRAVLDDPAGARERAARASAFCRGEYDITVTARRHAALYRELIAEMRAANALISAARS